MALALAVAQSLDGRADGFAQCRMRVNRLADVYRICPHLNRQRNLADHVARMGADHAAAQDFDTGFHGGDLLAVGRAAYGLQPLRFIGPAQGLVAQPIGHQGHCRPCKLCQTEAVNWGAVPCKVPLWSGQTV